MNLRIKLAHVIKNIIILILFLSYQSSMAFVAAEGKGVADHIAPEIQCPGDVSVDIYSGCTGIVNWTPPSASDPSGIKSLTSTHDPGDAFPIGTTTVTYTATNTNDEVSTCSFDVTVDYVLSCPSDITINVNNACNRAVFWAEPNAECNFNVLKASDFSPGDQFPIGTTTVRYLLFSQDFSTFLGECTFDVTVNDNINPTFSTCPGNITLSANDNCEAVASWTEPIASDNCADGFSLSSNFEPGDVFPLGTTTVTYTAEDAAGNQATCSFDVTVEDQSDPVFTDCPSDIVISANENCEAVATWSAPEVTDNCTASPSIIQTHESGATFPLGTTIVTYTATDDEGNQAICSFSVIVEDQTAPVVANACPGDIILTANGTCQQQATWVAPTFTDNCSASLDVTATHNSGALFPIGNTTVSYTATDEAGNERICSFTVTVIDETAPTITGCPEDITISATESCGAVVNWIEPRIRDNCHESLEAVKSHEPGDIFPRGTTTVTYIATDDAGNETTCTFQVTVIDETAPAITDCPLDITVSASANCTAEVSWVSPTIFDNCTENLQITSTHESGDVFALGETEVTYTAIDNAGNSSTCSFIVTVEDTSDPFLVSKPSDITASAMDGCVATVNWEEPVFEDCTQLHITSTHNAGESFPIGTTEVVYTATDSLGRTTTSAFLVEVIDDMGPSIENCPSDITISTDGACETSVEWEAPNAIDNCSEVTVESDFNSGDTFNLGENVVTYTFTDENGNESTCSFKVIVNNPIESFINNCPEDIVVDSDEFGNAIVEWEEPVLESVCHTYSVERSHNVGDQFSVGTTEVRYDFINEVNDTLTCSFNVQVNMKEILFEVSQMLTPNNDGVNDTWQLEDIEEYPDNEVIIVDRWGSPIFKTQGYNNENNAWDGTNQNGDPVPTGTYFYQVSVRFASSTETKKGFIELVR